MSLATRRQQVSFVLLPVSVSAGKKKKKNHIFLQKKKTMTKNTAPPGGPPSDCSVLLDGERLRRTSRPSAVRTGGVAW